MTRTRTLILGASGGIGAALAEAARARGEDVATLSRRADGFDVTDEAAVARCLGALSGSFERIVVATGLLAPAGQGPEKTLRQIDPAAFAEVVAVNALGPLLVLKHALPLLPRDRRAVFAALSARVGSIGDNRAGGWYAYRAAKAALNQGLRTASIEVARTHPKAVVAALHPGTVATPFTAAYQGRHAAVPPSEAARNLLEVMDALTPAETGAFRDWSGAEVPW